MDHPQSLRSKLGSLAIFEAIRLASSFVSNFADDRRSVSPTSTAICYYCEQTRAAESGAGKALTYQFGASKGAMYVGSLLARMARFIIADLTDPWLYRTGDRALIQSTL
jgi:hypothetical protein